LDKESNISRLANELSRIAPSISPSIDPAWSRPIAIRVIDCVLSLNRNYDNFVVPRLRIIMNKHPDLSSIHQLDKLMSTYSSPALFVEAELNYNYADRARILEAVVHFLCKLVDGVPVNQEAKVLEQWAKSTKPIDYRSLKIKGFALAGYQYLRMLLGASTTKPDKHIKNFVSEILERRVSDVEALELLENAANLANLSIRDVDTTIWEARARS